MLKRARNQEDLDSRVRLICADATKMPFKEGSFDGVISAYGLGGVEDINSAMKEIKRAGKSGAEVVFAEMSETPEYYPLRRLIHRYVVEPWIKFFWKFRDLDLPKLLEHNGISLEYQEFLNDYFIGSTTLVKGRIKK